MIAAGGRRVVRAIAAAALAAIAATAGAAPPDIVVIVADDWGFTDLGAYGAEFATPNIDALARDGVRFSNFHVAASCAPTRAMLLTGVEHHRAGVGNLTETMPGAHRGRPGYLGSLSDRVVTVATLLREAGYRTVATGKWNVGTEPHNRPDRRGFERSLVQGDTGSDHWVPSQRYLPHTDRVHWFEDGRQATMPAEYYSSEYFVDKAIEYLGADPADARPLFAYVAFQANHAPLQAPRAFIERHRGRYDAGWDVLRRERRDRAAALGLVPAGAPLATLPTTPDWSALDDAERRRQARSMEVYAAMSEAMDHHVGRLLAWLRTHRPGRETVFVFLSDNGPEGADYADARLWLMTQYSRDVERLGDRGVYAILGPGWASAAAAPLSGHKFYAGEGALRVPMIVAGVPGQARGAVHPGLAHVLDVVPTLLEVAGVAPPGTTHAGRPIEPLAGRSLVPVLHDPGARLRGPDDAIGYELAGNRALYVGDLKLVSNLRPLDDGRWRLYDLAVDPGESDDLAPRRPDLVAALAARYDAWAEAHGVLPMPEGYDPMRQVLVNSVVNYWIPAYRTPALAVLAALVAAAWLLNRRRVARRAGSGR